ncbi:MAG TPA: galactokinase family protein [Phycisphaerae bacterium]|nr:galactokinase family protein [Phycisphaerae bacterium]HRR84481.1 galactokinase family protein [Phycisphaerae bacterium]
MDATLCIQRPSPDSGMAGVVLCGGKGSRMGRARIHKVCEPIAGRPAVVRLLDTLQADGVDPIVVVVGHNSGAVVQTIGASHAGVVFVYQRDRLGTGHAARIGVEALARLGYQGTVLVTMGDKWLAPNLVQEAGRRFRRLRADLLLVTTPKRPEGSGGRLVNLPGRGIIGIVERRDIDRARVLRDWFELAASCDTLSRALLRHVGLKRIRPAVKLWRALGPLAGFSRGSGRVRSSELLQALREAGMDVRVGGTTLGPEKIEQYSKTVNESVYVGDINVLQAALHRVGRANAQDEYYVTDMIEIIGRGLHCPENDCPGRVVEYEVRRDQVMAFNTREELFSIEEHVRKQERDLGSERALKKLAPALRSCEEWLAILRPAGRRAQRLLERAYGVDGSVVMRRIGPLRGVVRLWARAFDGKRKIFLVRAPGRLNLMGRHIDHQGGFVHSMALDCEVVMAVSPRQDDVVRLVNADPVAFPARELVIGDWLAALRTPDWLSFVDGQRVRTHLMSTAGDWSNYVLASVLYQQYMHRGRRLCGMDVAVSGNVPIASGLSSSSAMVVAAMEAIVAVNGIAMSPSEIVPACGQAEWFVGSRGGAGDHAAIRLGKAGHVARMGFHPFSLSRYVRLPSDLAVLVAYSGQHAVKSAGARDRFNERVACYRIGMMLLQKKYPRLAKRLQYVRDLTPAYGVFKPHEVDAVLESLPERISRRQIRARLGQEFEERLARVFASHTDPGQYTIRDVVVFGVSECERSRLAADLLDRKDLPGFGEMVLLSHDGDRVSGSPAAEAATAAGRKAESLWRMTGAYACSTPNIDRLVDLASAVPGVYGAQLAGAGLGGCVIILARQSAVPQVRATLAREYYGSLGLAPCIWRVRPVAGGGIIRP